MECPITYELFSDHGDNTPLMLSACGHTISAVAASHLVAKEKAKQKTQVDRPVSIRCPICTHKQHKVFTANDLPQNLALINSLRAKANRHSSQRKHVAGTAVGWPPADPGAARPDTNRKKLSFSESGPHQPCVMPACGHTVTRAAVQKLLRKSPRSQAESRLQQAERNDELTLQAQKLSDQLFPVAIVCLLSLLFITARPDGVICSVVRVFLLAGCLYMRWKMRVYEDEYEDIDTSLPDTKDPAATYTVHCPCCGAQQSGVKDASEFPPNWMLIELMREEAAGQHNAVTEDSSDPTGGHHGHQQRSQAPCTSAHPTKGTKMHRVNIAAPACARLSRTERHSILETDFSSGLSHSLKVANRQKLIDAVEAAVWIYIDEAQHLQAVLAPVPEYHVMHLVTCAARNILNSSEDTAVISMACLNLGSSINRLLQTHWPDSPVLIRLLPRWLQKRCVVKSKVCQALQSDMRDAGEHHSHDGSIWQFGPPEKPENGLVYAELEQLFFEALCNVSLEVLDVLQHALDYIQFRRAMNRMFSCLYSHSPSDDTVLALLGSCKHRLDEVVEVGIVTAVEAETGRGIDSLLQDLRKAP